MATEFDIARHQYQNYRFCYDNGHEQWLQTAKRSMDFFFTKQWDEATKARLAAQGRPALTFNRIEPLVRSITGIHRALRHDVRFMPQQTTSPQDARVMDAVWLDTQNKNNFDELEMEILQKGVITGRGYYDVRVCYDDSFSGTTVIRGRRSQDVILDPSIEEYDTEDWPQVNTRRWVSYQDIVRKFGKEKAEAATLGGIPDFFEYEDRFLGQQMGDIPYYQHLTPLDDSRAARALLLLDRQYHVFKKKDVFVDMMTGDTSEIPETWDRNRIAKCLELAPGLNTMKREVKTVRWTQTCNDVVLHDDDSPYKRFTVVPFFPTFLDGKTMGLVELLLDGQELFNKMTSSELHIINTTANSGYKIKTGSLKNMTVEELEERGSTTGFVAELDDPADLEKLTPNQTPAGHDRLSFKADQIMSSIAGVSNQARGFAREDVAGEAITANQAASDINFAGWFTNHNRSKKMVARSVLECVQGHYTETRVVQINRGSIYNPKFEQITLNEPSAEGGFMNDVSTGKYTTALVPSPIRTVMSEEDFNLLVKLRTEVGILIPDDLLIELSPANNKAQIIEALGGASSSAERQKQADEAAAAQAEAEMAEAQARVEKELSAAALNNARAEKFVVEAQSDPDAAFERVEFQRMQNDAINNEKKLALEERKFGFDQKKHADDVAVKLTQIDMQRETAKENAKAKAAADAKKPKPGMARKSGKK